MDDPSVGSLMAEKSGIFKLLDATHADQDLVRPALYAVAVPIGHIWDLSLRAFHTLRDCDLIFAEDSRKAGLLLAKLGIHQKRLVPLHDHNESAMADSWPQRLQTEHLAAVVMSDAGTPCMSDPGFKLFRAAHAIGLTCKPIPGPAAAMALLSVAGIATDRFCFVGFLPNKASKRQAEVEGWLQWAGITVVFFETANRVEKSLRLLADMLPQARISFGRELTKVYEEVRTFDTVADCWQFFLQGRLTLKGEFVWAVEIPEATCSLDGFDDAVKQAFRQGYTSKEILQEWLAKGAKKNQIYPKILELKKDLE